jgi:hypothetical protein
MRSALRRALLSTAAVPAAALAATALAAPAGAQVQPGTAGPGIYSKTEAGYSATGATFRYVKADYVLPDATTFAGSLKRVEYVSEMWSPTRVTMLGVYASTGGSPKWHIEAKVFNPKTKTLICATSGPGKHCAGTPASWATITIPVGHTAQLTTVFTQSTGTVRFSVYDQVVRTTKHKYIFSYNAGTKPFTDGRLGAELGCTPWAGCGSAAPAYTKPGSPVLLIQAGDCEFMTTTGPLVGFDGAFIHRSVTMTSDGTATGTPEAVPMNLQQGAADFPLGQFDVYLQ